MGVGSYLDNLSPDYSGYIWGTGKLFEKTKVDLPKAKILALRGILTLNSLVKRPKTVVLGDPGLLCKLVAPIVIKKYKLGIIPHWNDYSLVRKYPQAHYIDITNSIENVIYETSLCKRIISTSLHGTILADSLDIPNMWLKTRKSPGRGFKFVDYRSVFDDFVPAGEWYQPDQNKIDKINQDLLEVLNQI
jgi:hypothetical protein